MKLAPLTMAYKNHTKNQLSTGSPIARITRTSCLRSDAWTAQLTTAAVATMAVPMEDIFIVVQIATKVKLITLFRILSSFGVTAPVIVL